MTDETQAAPAAEQAATAADAAPTSSPSAGAAKAPATKTYLTAVASDEYGPAGHFLALDPAAAKPDVKAGLLLEPTPEQLAAR